MHLFPKPLRLFPVLLLVACGTDDSDSLLTSKPEAATRKMTALEQKFDLFDWDGDGFLTRRELSKGLRSIGTPGVTDEKVDKIFAYYDADKNGRISLHEAQRGNAAGPAELLKMFDE